MAAPKRRIIFRPSQSKVIAELAKPRRDHPYISVEMVVWPDRNRRRVTERYDDGVQSGEQVAKDMIAVRSGPDLRMGLSLEGYPGHRSR
jgi:hypothetical protein